MKHKIRTTEQDIVRDIIGYNFPKDELARNTLIAKIATFALDNMSMDYMVEGKTIRIDDDIQIRRRNNAYICLDKSQARISPKTFANGRRFGEDIISVCHEIGHFAENTEDIASGKRCIGNSSCIDNQKLLSFTVRYIMAIGEYSRFKAPEGFVSIAGLGNIIPDYTYARYILDPFEARARRFACDMLEKMIDIANEDIGITSTTSYLNIKQMKKALDTRRDQDYINIAKANKTMAEHHKYFVDMVRSAREGLLIRDKSGKNAFDRLRSVPRPLFNAYVQNRGDIIEDSFLGLIIDYDNDMANTIVDTIINLDNEIYDNYFPELMNICARTDFVPSAEQLEIMQERGFRGAPINDSVLDMIQNKEVLHCCELQA